MAHKWRDIRRSSKVPRDTKLFNATIEGEEVCISLPYSSEDIASALEISEKAKVELEELLYMLRGRCEGRKA